MSLFAFWLLFFLFLQLNHRLVRTKPQQSHPESNLTYFQSPLDTSDRFRLFWNVDYDSKTVTFEVRAKLRRPGQWFAIGFSDYGQVPDSDLCILWLDFDSKTHFQVSLEGVPTNGPNLSIEKTGIRGAMR